MGETSNARVHVRHDHVHTRAFFSMVFRRRYSLMFVRSNSFSSYGGK